MSSTMKISSRFIIVLFFFCSSSHIDCLIIPEQFVEFLANSVYSLPKIKKGIDSRLGGGFRLGEHADFQVIVELGPQKRTEFIGNEADIRKKRATLMESALNGELGPWAQAVAEHDQVKTNLKKYNILSDSTIKNRYVNNEAITLFFSKILNIIRSRFKKE